MVTADFSMRELLPFDQLTPMALFLFVVLNFAFVSYYLVRYRKYGVLTLDSYFTLRYIYIPVVFMFPFAFSSVNSVLATGPAHYYYVGKLHMAFYVGVVGILFFAVGGALARLVDWKLPLFDTVAASLDRFWLTNIGSVIGVVGVIAQFALLAILGFQIGNARDTALRNPSLMPIYNMYAIYVSFVGLVVLTYAYRKSSRLHYVLGLMAVGAGLVGGTRATSVGVIVSFLAVVSISTRYKNLFAAFVFGSGLVSGGIYLGAARSGYASLQTVEYGVLYGNNLSDLRDFAWILSGWDQTLLLGKTYFAGFISFVPATLSAFRYTWGWGRFSTATAGLDPDYHAGLRPIIFGEMYLNFGWLGVMVGACLTGFVIFSLSRMIERRWEGAPRRERVLVALSAVMYLELVLQFLVTAGFFSFYIILILLMSGLLLHGLSVVKRRAVRP